MNPQTGKTKDAGHQFGLRKTFPYPAEQMRDFIFSGKGLQIWLGILENELEIKKPYKTKKGFEGVVRVFKPLSHIRLTWKKKDWENTSLVQVRVIEKGEKSTLSFHQEKLQDANQRAEMKEYWNKKMNEIRNSLQEKASN